MNTKVYLERIDSALLGYSSNAYQFDVTYDGGAYSNFDVKQRGNQTIVPDNSYIVNIAFFAFKIPDQYIGKHSGIYHYIKATDSGNITAAKIFPCFVNPSEYLNAGCDHINKKISWGDLYGTYGHSFSDRVITPVENWYYCYTTDNHYYLNLLDPCGAKYVILLMRIYPNQSVVVNPTLALDIETDLSCADIESIYPNDISIKKDIIHNFSWNVKGSDFNPQERNNIRKPTDKNINTNYKLTAYTFYEAFTFGHDGYESAQPCPTYLKSHTLYYRKKGTSQYTQISETNDHNYVEIPVDTFDIDTYEYYVAQTLENGYTVYTPLTEFYAIGQDAAPTISGVTNNSIPTVSWTDSNQAAFEIRIKDAEQNIVYTSGLIVGDNQSYQITKMLPNGTYIVEVRELNIYGIYSNWGSAQFVLNPSSVSAPTDIFVSVNNKLGVEISGTPVGSAQKTYVVRRVAGTDDIEIVGIYTGGIFTDYTAKGNTYYEYSLRNYNVAYADGAFIPVEVKVKEAIIQDGRDATNFLDLSWSEDVTFNIEYTDEADRTLYNCLGRRYPVKEMGEWVNSVRSFVAYVRAEDINRLNDMNLNAPKVYFKGNHEYYACDMSIEDQGAYVGGGRMIRFTLTRIADDEGIII